MRLVVLTRGVGMDGKMVLYLRNPTLESIESPGTSKCGRKTSKITLDTLKRRSTYIIGQPIIYQATKVSIYYMHMFSIKSWVSGDLKDASLFPGLSICHEPLSM
jgi:hypothetical protein